MISHPLARLLKDGRASIAMPLQRAKSAKVIWLNGRAILQDPNFANLNCSREAYSQYLLEQCAVTAADKSIDCYGWADRYGGSGLGSNGGSGRSVFLGDYYVKGVGPTALIGQGNSPSHTSGGAYLEEAVREVIQGEYFEQRMPWGTVPILALIDLGITQVWPDGYSPQQERRVLIIRPQFLRPAHFERALYFHPRSHADKIADMERISYMANEVIAIVGIRTFSDFLKKVYCRWTEQVAFGYSNGLTLGGYSPSNVTINGALVDFGGATIVPLFANVCASANGGPRQDQNAITQSLRSLQMSLTQVLSPDKVRLVNFAEIKANLDQTYRETICIQFFYRLGLTRGELDRLIGRAGKEVCLAVSDRFVRGEMRKRYDLESADAQEFAVNEPGDMWRSPVDNNRPFHEVLRSTFSSQELDQMRFRSETSVQQSVFPDRIVLRRELLERLDAVGDDNVAQITSEIIDSYLARIEQLGALEIC